MGKKLVIVGADFSANSFHNAYIDFDSYNSAENYLDSNGIWCKVDNATKNNKHMLIPIPSGSTKLIVDASVINRVYQGETANLSADVIVAFLSGMPSDTSDGTQETKFSSRDIINEGSELVYIDIPTGSTVLYLQTGYFGVSGADAGHFIQSRIPNNAFFRIG